MDFFLLKKIIGVLLMPLSISLILLLISLVLFNRNARLARRCLFAATALLLAASLAPISDRFMHPLEHQYEAFTKSSEPVDYIVILGCGHTTNDALPASLQLKDCSMRRLVEGLRILKLHPEAQLITSGFGGPDESPNAEVVKQTAMLLGVPERKILVEPFPKDTQEEAALIAPRLIGKNAVLVTDGDHLPRAVKYFELEGAQVTPAPAGFWVVSNEIASDWGYYVPKSEKLSQTSIFWYQTMGMLWQWIAY